MNRADRRRKKRTRHGRGRYRLDRERRHFEVRRGGPPEPPALSRVSGGHGWIDSGRREGSDVPGRVLIISDAHGYPDLIRNALLAGGFRPAVDTLVYAGDFIDRGPDPHGCLELIEERADVVLVGNHELAVLVGFELFEQTPESRSLRQVFLDRVFAADPPVAWRAAVCIDGILITHGGVSRRYAQLFIEECRGSPELLAERLNEEFLRAVRQELESGSWDDDGILGDRGPLWFRPREWGGDVPLPGLTQVVGHSPPVEALEADGFYMVDPCVFRGRGDPGRYRYAVVEHGRVRVEEGTLSAERVPMEVWD